MTLSIARRVADLRAQIAGARKAGKRIGFVPTMGALHAGHLALVDAARRDADYLVASIFVNPTQFGPSEDLDAYPRDEAGDLAALARVGVDLAYLPGVADMYAPGDATRVTVAGSLSEVLCGPVRPGHFQGVATVVAKLFGQVQPDVAAFGEKDYQQLLVVKRLVEDLAMPVRIVPVATLREADGLAMSSRNRRLSADLRAIAAHLPTTMARAAARILAGGDAHACAKDAAGELSAKGFGPIDYVELRDAATLALAMAPPARLFAAAHLGGVRLIDNIAVG